MAQRGLRAIMKAVAVHRTARRFGAKVASMKSLVRICLAAGVTACCLPAHSQTLGCNGHIVETGDARAPVYYAPGLQRVPEPFANSVVPCLVVEEWLREPGPG